VIIIAHRLATVIDADRILVMSGGEAEEFDHPYKLLVNEVGASRHWALERKFPKGCSERWAATATAMRSTITRS